MTIRAHLDQLLDNPDDPRDGLGRSTAVVFCGDLNDEACDRRRRTGGLARAGAPAEVCTGL